ncbi:LysE family translocator [Fuscibacter oryzae]|uniref:LysE family transporter n=1 Tax=Fuscibacter oryzae TaxID=2803939 RepID=A0A8J7MVK0_9RHOB|nr:LysE family transporter [Fuscibacter oryzae]MBL4928589.1 LysE family transporter [Fuscibacter oryzae]
MSFAAFLAFALLTLLGAVSPGPAVLVAARTGLNEGFRVGFFLAMGIGAGAVFWAASAMFGLAILFKMAPSLLIAFKLIGGGYLLYLGFKLWRDAAQPFVSEDASPTPRSAISAFRRGVTTQLSNPKAVAFFSVVLLGAMPPHTPLWQRLALLAVIFVNETVWNTLVARIFSLDRTRAAYISLKSIIDRCFGGALALLGLKLAAT